MVLFRGGRRWRAPRADDIVRWWVLHGTSMRSVAERYGKSKGFVQHAVELGRAYFRGNRRPTLAGLFEALRPLPRGGRRPGSTKITAAHLTFLRGLLDGEDTAFLTCAGFATRLVRRFRGRNVPAADRLHSISVSTISRVVRGTLGYTLKLPEVKNARRYTEANAARYRAFVEAHFDDFDAARFGDPRHEIGDMARWTARRDPGSYFFTDESGFNVGATRRPRGRAPRGQRLVVAGNQDRGPHHTLVIIVAAGGGGGVVARAWKRSGPGRGNGFTRADFVALLRGAFARRVRRHRAALPAPRRANPLYLVMDNASIHKGPAVEAALAEIGVAPVYLPPYCPELNPCELVFAKLKGSLRSAHEVALAAARAPAAGSRLSAARAQSTWLRQRVHAHLASISPADVLGFYRRCAWRTA